MRIEKNNYIKQLRLHNEKALMYVIDTYGGLLMAVIRKKLIYLPDRQEECFDDVMLKIWQNIGSFDESKNTFQNWAAAIARYHAIDYLRRYQKEMESVSMGHMEIAEEDHMLGQIIGQEISEEMESMLAALKPADRELFLKRYVEEKPVEQISEETGMKKEIIYNRLSRGRHKIRRHLLRERGI